ncbi:hypothetical protein ACJD0Z_13130 [Flavobacteriaceae bacterium M23B6Z8]
MIDDRSYICIIKYN